MSNIHIIEDEEGNLLPQTPAQALQDTLIAQRPVYTAESGLQYPEILPPDRHRLRRRAPSRLRRKRRSPRLGLLQKTRNRHRAQAIREEPRQLQEQHRNASDLETATFQDCRKIRSGLLTAVFVFLSGVNIKIKTNSARSISTSAEFVFLL